MMEVEKECPEYSVYAVKNTRRLMEDRHVVIPNLLSQFKVKSDNHYSYYAIFDGHAGPDAAQFAADNLHKNLVESNFFKSGNITDAFRCAYATTDFQYTEKSLNDGIKAGCTAVTCLLENNRRLYLAWVGDSVALLSRNGKPAFIMEPHNLERDDEKERVEAMGGTVIYFDTWRVNGTLGVSRAIGDPEYKPYVCADPDIETIDLDGTEDFLIIGCDGLWDRMTPEDAIGLIYEHLHNNSHLSVNELVNSTAQILADKSINDGSSDNVTTIVLFLKDVSSILNSSVSSLTQGICSSVNGDKFISPQTSSTTTFKPISLSSSSSLSTSPSSVISSSVPLDKNNGHVHVDYNNGDDGMNYNHNHHTNNNTSNSNNNTTNNGLVHDYEYASTRMDNGLNSGEEVIGSGGFNVEKVGGVFGIGGEDGDGELNDCEIKEKKKDEEKVNLGSTLNPFADEFQPNISNSNTKNKQEEENIGSVEIGNEPKKDDEESHKNEKLDKKDLWMSEFKDDDGNNEFNQQQQQQHHHHHHQHHQQHDQKQEKHDDVEKVEGKEYHPKQIEMFDGLVNNGLNYSENLSCSGLSNQHHEDEEEEEQQQQRQEQSTGNLSSSEYEDNLSSEMIIHNVDENASNSQQQQQQQLEPSAPELVFIEQQQQQQQQSQQYSSTMDSNLISQAETFVGNLTPTETPSSPVVTLSSTSTSTTVRAKESEFNFDTQSSTINNQCENDVNQYITSVSDGMISEPYHDPYFASDSVEPQSMILNPSNDVISSGPHAIDPYAEKDDKIESFREKEGEENVNGGDGDGEGNLFNLTGKINIEDTQSIPLESLNPFSNNTDVDNNGGFNVSGVVDEFGGSVDISTGDATKSSFYGDNPDNSCGLLDFSDDQVNTIVITPNSSGYGYLTNESKLEERLGDEKTGIKEEDNGRGKYEEVAIEERIEEMKISDVEKEKTENVSSIGKKSSSEEEEEEEDERSTIVKTEGLINQIEREKVDLELTGISSQKIETVTASDASSTATFATTSTTATSAVVASTVTAGVVGAVGAGVAAKISSSKISEKKETISKTTVSKKSTLPSTRATTSRTSTTTAAATSRATTATTSTTRKPLASSSTVSSSRLTSSIKSSSSLATSKLTTSRQPTSTSTSTSNVRNSSSTSRVGISSTMNKRPTQTSTTTTSTSSSSTTRVSSLASRATTSTLASSRGTTTSKPLTRTTTTTTSSGLSSRRPGTTSSATSTTSSSTTGTKTSTTARSTLTSRLASATSRTTTTTKPSTISSSTTASTSGLSRTTGSVASKRASTGTMLNRPSPGASTLSKSSTSALNRSLTSSSSSPSSSSTLSKSSTRPSTTSTSTTRAPLGRTLGTKSSSAKGLSSTAAPPNKPSTSTTKVAVPRLGAKKAVTATADGGPIKDNNNSRLEGSSSTLSTLSSGIRGDDGTSTSNYRSEQQEKTSCSTPVDAITTSTTSSIKREKNLMPNSANSLKDELEAALASPISCEDKGVIMETKDDEPSENL